MRSGLRLHDQASPARSALIIVDVQNDYCDPNGACGRQGNDLSRINSMCSAIEMLRVCAHRAGVPSVFVRSIHTKETDSVAWLQRSDFSNEVCRPGTEGAAFYSLSPGEDDVVVDKHRYSAFVGTRLGHVLRTMRRDTLILTGTQTNACVESTARDGFMLDYNIVVVDDATATTSVDAHQASLANVRRYFGLVATAAALADVWSAVAVSDG